MQKGATVVQDKGVLVSQGSMKVRWPTGGSDEVYFLCVCVCE